MAAPQLATKMASGPVNQQQRSQIDRSDINLERVKLDTIRLNDNYEVEELFIKEWLKIL